MRISFLLSSQTSAQTSAFFVMAGELAKSHSVTVFAGKQSQYTFNGVNVAPLSTAFQWFTAVIALCFSRLDVLHLSGSSLFLTLFIRVFHPFTRFIYSGISEPTSVQRLFLHFVDDVIVHDASLQKVFIQKTKILPVFLSFGISRKRFAIDSRVLSAFSLSSFSFVTLHAEHLNDAQIAQVCTFWKTLTHEQKRGVKLVILGKKSFSIDRDTLFLPSLSLDAKQMIYAGALTHVFLASTSFQDADVLEALSFGRPALLEHGAVSDRRLLFAQLSTKQMEELFAYISGFIQDPIEASSYGHIGRTLVEEEFAKEVLAKDWELLYTKGLAYGEGYLSARER